MQKNYRDTYQAHTWISGQDAAFLDSLFPGDELDHQIVQAIRMLQSIKRHDNSNQQLEINELRDRVNVLSKKNEALLVELEATRALVDRPSIIAEVNPEQSVEPIGKGADVHVARPEGDPISDLQQRCQQSGILGLPKYKLTQLSSTHFRCICQVGDISCEAEGRSKKVAKAWAANLALKMINTPQQPAFEKPRLRVPKELSPDNDLAVQRIVDLCDASLRGMLSDCSIKFMADNLLNIQCASFGIHDRLKKRAGAIKARAEKVCGYQVQVRVECRPVRKH